MARYTTVFQTLAGANLTIGAVQGAAAARPMMAHLILGSEATPANLAGEFAVLPHTTAGITPSATPNEAKIDPTHPVALCNAMEGTFATEPVYGSDSFLMIPLNQQATFQWWANPGFEPRTAVGTANGIGVRSIAHGGVPNINVTFMWEE